MKKCPYCSEEIQDEAIKCKHCGESLVSPKEGIANYAGFWRRATAILIDGVIMAGVVIIMGGIFGAMIGGFLGAIGINPDSPTFLAVVKVFCYILDVFLYWLYFTLFERSTKQATLGKMILGIVVTDMNGKRISFAKANGRYWGKIVSSIILGIGFIMVGFTEKKQALHDIMAGTLVVKR